MRQSEVVRRELVVLVHDNLIAVESIEGSGEIDQISGYVLRRILSAGSSDDIRKTAYELLKKSGFLRQGRLGRIFCRLDTFLFRFFQYGSRTHSGVLQIRSRIPFE